MDSCLIQCFRLAFEKTEMTAREEAERMRVRQLLQCLISQSHYRVGYRLLIYDYVIDDLISDFLQHGLHVIGDDDVVLND